MIKISNTKSLERLENFLKSSDKKVFVIHDSDGDGITSGKLIIEALKKLNVPVVGRKIALSRNSIFNMDLLENLVKSKANTILFTDLDITATDYSHIKEHLTEFDIIAFDHHQLRIFEEPNVIYFHPTVTFNYDNPSQFCSAQLVYQVMKEFVDLSEFDWVMSIGTISDVNYKTWKELVDNTLKKYNMEITEDIFDSRLAKIGHMLFNARAMGDKAIYEATDIFMDAINYEQAEKELAKFKIVDEEIDYIMDNWEKYAEQIDDIYFIELKTKYNLGSLVSTKISMLKQGYTVVTMKESDIIPDMLSMSCRRQDGNVDLNKLLQLISNELIDCSGGGHRVASGARCRVDDKDKFKELFVKFHKELKNE